jgi:NYN domain
MNKSSSGIALIVDIENIKISTAMETAIVNLFPEQEIIKIAVGNWRLLNLDSEMRSRGYHLFHVPTGHDNADLEIINLGWLLKDYHELIIVSNDNIFIQFVHQVNSRGKTAYIVYRSKSQSGFIITKPQILLAERQNLAIGNLTTNFKFQPIPGPDPRSALDSIAADGLFTSEPQFTQALEQLIAQNKTISTPEALASEFHKKFGIKVSIAVAECQIPVNFNKFVIDNGILSVSNAREELVANIREIIRTDPDLATDPARMGHEFKKLYGIAISEKMRQVGVLGNFRKFIAEIQPDRHYELN